MKLPKFLKRKQVKRRLFAFQCDPELIMGIKYVAKALEVPQYPLVEHLIQMGIASLYDCVHNEDLKRYLQNHIFKDHLFKNVLDYDNSYDRKAALRAYQASKLTHMREDLEETGKFITDFQNMLKTYVPPVKTTSTDASLNKTTAANEPQVRETLSPKFQGTENDNESEIIPDDQLFDVPLFVSHGETIQTSQPYTNPTEQPPELNGDVPKPDSEEETTRSIQPVDNQIEESPDLHVDALNSIIGYEPKDEDRPDESQSEELGPLIEP